MHGERTETAAMLVQNYFLVVVVIVTYSRTRKTEGALLTGTSAGKLCGLRKTCERPTLFPLRTKYVYMRSNCSLQVCDRDIKVVGGKYFTGKPNGVIFLSVVTAMYEYYILCSLIQYQQIRKRSSVDLKNSGLHICN